MKRFFVPMGPAAALCAIACAAGAAEYDFYSRTRYPEGGRLLPGVDLHKPAQTGTGAAKAYERRTVKWWPRKGVDVIEVAVGMPLREWTWREQQPGRPAKFKAHLIAFRGIGNTMSSKFRGDGGPIEPAVVLRLSDGRKRCFLRGSFCEADKKFIMGLYVKAMDRIKAGLDRTPLAKRPDADVKFPNNAKPGEPGTMQVESERFIWLSGSQAGSDDDPWVNAIAPDKAAWFRKGSIECAESWWALNEYAGHLMPYWDRRRQLKYEITVPGTKRDGHQVIPGFAGGGYGGCGIKGAGGGPWAGALFHEWGHGARSNGWKVGGGEAQADAHQTLATPVLKGNHHVTTPWRNIFNGGMGYGYTVFYNIIADDPNWGYAWYVCLPSGAGEQSIMQIAARVGEQRGLFKEGIRGFGDMVGEYGARLATFDCELEDMYRKAYLAPARSWLEPVDRSRGEYRIPMEEAPEPYGVNIVRLVADEYAAEIVVDFAGHHDPDLYGDWRACIVAVGADGRSRYSPLWSKGEMSLECRAGDVSYWLTVAATPTAIYGDSTAGRSQVQAIYSGRYAYRYPWSVRLRGARPGTPRECRADFGDVKLQYKMNDPVPAPGDTPAGRAFLARLETFTGQLSAGEKAEALRSRARDEMVSMNKGRRHPNGGGWVAETATVAPTAYVGADAMVLGEAKVLDQAIVEDYAIVTGKAVVSGRARIGGQAVVKDAARAGGYSRVWHMLTKEASVVPKRLGADGPDKNGLWANYAMDRDEKTVLTDWYRFAHGTDKRYGRRLGVDLSGYLVGRPTFVVDGDRRGFRFDGKKQHAELCPRVADLGEMTVDISLKWEGQGSQTIFDFGSSTDDRLVLRTSRRGRPEVVATVAGRTVVRASARKALPSGTWARLRVETGGEALSLWVDGEKVASEETSFRPCDVFPAGQVKRNVVAAARDGSNGFKGVVDHVVVYHTVHEDFSKAPAPILDSPLRPTTAFIEVQAKVFGNITALNVKVKALSQKMLAPYYEFEKHCKARQKELLERDEGYLRAVADLAAAKQAVERLKRGLSEAFARLPENAGKQAEVDAARRKNDDLRRKVQDLERERFEADDELKSLQARRNAAEDKRRSVERELRKTFDKRADVVEEHAAISELRKQIDQLRREVHRIEQETRGRDERLTALYARRKEIEGKRREVEKALDAEFRTLAKTVEIDGRIADAHARRNNRELGQKERDAAAREENDLRHGRSRMWERLRNASPEYRRHSDAMNPVNREVGERERAARAEARKTSAAAREYDGLEAKKRARERALHDRFWKICNADVAYAEAGEVRGEVDRSIRNRQEALRKELRASEPVAREQTRAEQEFQALERALRSERDVYAAKGAVDAGRQVAEAEKALKEATAEAWLAYEPERSWLASYARQSYRGYYNTAYTHYIPSRAKAIVGGGEMREDLNVLKALEKAVSEDEYWHTSVDWEWRMSEEVDGRIKDLPLMRKWLERVRGR
ncbi:MAG: DUF6055 domain-containing protein [Planctomycetota bacterium]|jgi:hypothetical protein